jgi:beta-galactosidase
MRLLRPLFAAFAAILFLQSAPALAADAPVRERISFNADWRFAKGEHGAAEPGFSDAAWRKLDLPHDWGIEGPFKQEHPGETGKLPWWGVAWYRKSFDVPAGDAGKRVYLDIDGAMANASVWLNGHNLGGWPYGYASWRVDLTPHLKTGAKNVLAIRLDNPEESSRWYPGGGIYRNTWLVKTSPVHVAHYGAFVTTPIVTADAATVDVQITLDNHGGNANVQVATEIYALDAAGIKTGTPVASSPMSPVTKQAAGRQALLAQSLSVAKPRLWSPRSPQRYLAVTTVSNDGKVVDVLETPFGIRTIAFDAARGFILNGERLALQGVCQHHDLGALGAALNVRALERQLEILREMGVNAIRTTHNPAAPELLDLADRMGFLIIAEAFDAWRVNKKKNDYGRLYDEWHEKDLRAMVRRDRNHPSVILWSIGNEISEQGKPEGWKVAAHLAEIVRGEDRTRPTTAGFNHVISGYNGFQTAIDVFGYNYKPTEYPKLHKSAPHLPIIGSETASTISSRGEYFFPVSDDKAKGAANFQVSSYDLTAPPWAWAPDVEFKGLDDNPFVAGEFVWTGFDYLGEPTPYNDDATNLLNFTDPAQQDRAAKELAALKKIKVPSRSSYFGIVDLAGFKKDRFYLYQARWRPELPMAHLLPHWNWPERVGQVTPVHLYTSGDEAELFLNGQSLGRKKRGPRDYRLRWDDVVYQPGTLKAVAYKDGKPWAEDTVRTTGKAARLALAADRSVLRADGSDLAFITVTVADKDGRQVPKSNNRVSFSLTGPGEIIATDNGDATSFESFQSRERNAFNGLALVIVRTKAGQGGKLVLTAKSEGLGSTQVALASSP